MRRQSTSKSDGKSKYVLFLYVHLFYVFAILVFTTTSWAQVRLHSEPKLSKNTNLWEKFDKYSENKIRLNQFNGLSYIISGSLGILGGYAGQSLAQDPLEKGVYTIFQTIGIASVGYGAFIWKIGDEDRSFYETVRAASHLDDKARSSLIRTYFEKKRERQKQERAIKAITHGLIAALNIYNASQLENNSLRNGLYFIGGVNALAAISFSFSF